MDDDERERPHERYEVEDADILFEDTWAEEAAPRVRCPACGDRAPKDAARCPRCGETLPRCLGVCSMCSLPTCIGEEREE